MHLTVQMLKFSEVVCSYESSIQQLTEVIIVAQK